MNYRPVSRVIPKYQTSTNSIQVKRNILKAINEPSSSPTTTLLVLQIGFLRYVLILLESPEVKVLFDDIGLNIGLSLLSHSELLPESSTILQLEV